ncbi:hypothetical protein U1Q18_037742, partial [Sarracenia purpurea var. burkii]
MVNDDSVNQEMARAMVSTATDLEEEVFCAKQELAPLESPRMIALEARIKRLKGINPVRINEFALELNWRSVVTQLAPVETMVGNTSVEDIDPNVADNKVKSDLLSCELEIGDIDPTIELKVEPILASIGKPAEEVMGISAYAHEVFDKMIKPTLTTDRASDSE